jgi:hypothetical protein
MMHGHEKSDPAIVAGKPANKVAPRCGAVRGGVGCSGAGGAKGGDVLAMRDGELPAEPDVLASPRFAAKTRADLVVLQQQAERLLKRYENVLRIAATVLDTRGP